MYKSIKYVIVILLVGSNLWASKVNKTKEIWEPYRDARGAGDYVEVLQPVPPSSKSPGDTLHYDGANYDAIGLTSGGTYQAAVRFTPQELTGYNNWVLNEVIFFHYETGTHSGRVIIYGPGTSSSPGSIITEENYSATGQGWVSVTLTNPVPIDASQDIWVAVEITHQQGEYPIGVDAGPAVAGKGDFVSTDGATWSELTDYGLNYNWNIRAIVELAGDSLDPMPPQNLTAYSDYTTPTSIVLNWEDPTHYVGGDTLTDFYIEIWRDSVLIDTVTKGVQTYTDVSLVDGTLYTYQLRTHDRNDSTSAFVEVSWYAGGSPWPAPPQLNAVSIIDESTIEVIWTNPTTQSDGTPLDDLAGIYIYVDGIQVVDHPTTATGATIHDTVTVTPGIRIVYVTAYDNETPVHESEPSTPITVNTQVHSGGPDGFGYVFYDSDYSSGPSFEWIDATSGTPLNLDDDDNALITLPFEFPFYNEVLTELYVVSNGFITSTNNTDFSNEPLPDTTKHNLIAPFRDDLDPSSGGNIYYLATPDYAVIEWYQVPHYSSGGPYTFEVVLYPDGNIKFNYLSMPSRLDESTTGIQGGDGSGNYYLQYTVDGDPLVVHDSLTILFIRPVYDHDVALYSIDEPQDMVLVGTTVTPQVTVKNFGTNPETFDVVFEIYDASGIIYSDTQTVAALPSDTTTQVSFTPYTFDISGFDYSIVAYTLLTGDMNTRNDTATMNLVVYENIIDFETNDGGFVPDPSAGAWEWGIPTSGPGSAHSGSNVWATVLGGEYSNNADWSLYSIDLYATQDNPVLAFYHWYDIERSWDGGNVSISTDGGNTWTIIQPEGGYPDNDINGLNNEPGFTGASAGWELAKFNLSVPAGTHFKIRFHFGSDGSVTHDGWYIDDIITTGAVVGIGENNGGNIPTTMLYGPMKNPVTGIELIRFSVSRKANVTIDLYDVTGRRVKTLYNSITEPGLHSLRFDSRGLSRGIYFLRMKVNNDYSATKKIVIAH